MAEPTTRRSESGRVSYWTNVEFVVVVGFHHKKGNNIEFIYPPIGPGAAEDQGLAAACADADGGVFVPPEWREFSYFALPDGAHHVDEDTSYFWVPRPAAVALDGGIPVSQQRLHVTAYFKQISLDAVVSRSADMQRSSVQKAVCLLSSVPMYGAMENKAEMLARVFFEQYQAGKGVIGEQFDVGMLQECMGPPQDPRLFLEISVDTLRQGAPAKSIVERFRSNTLRVLKLILLQRRVLFFGSPARLLGRTVLAFLSLIPGQLEGTWLPLPSHLTELGLPLKLFDELQTLQPYLPMQGMSLIQGETDERKGYLVGASNMLFGRLTPQEVEVIVNVNTGTIEVRQNVALEKLLKLSGEDHCFMAKIARCLLDSGPAPEERAGQLALDQARLDSPSRLAQEGSDWLGGDSWVRQQFEEYFCGLLATLSTIPALADSDVDLEVVLEDMDRLSPADAYHRPWVNAWLRTRAGAYWRSTSKADITSFDHPCKDETNLDFGRAFEELAGKVQGLTVVSNVMNATKGWFGWNNGSEAQ